MNDTSERHTVLLGYALKAYVDQCAERMKSSSSDSSVTGDADTDRLFEHWVDALSAMVAAGIDLRAAAEAMLLVATTAKVTVDGYRSVGTQLSFIGRGLTVQAGEEEAIARH